MNATLATGPDGNRWTVTRRVNWRRPVTVDDFEHDVEPGSAAAVILLGMVIVLLGGVVLTVPDDSFAPKIILGLVLLFLFFPARWALRRPWTVVAETGDTTVERWTGTVRGVVAARREVARTVRAIEQDGHAPLEGALFPAH